MLSLKHLRALHFTKLRTPLTTLYPYCENPCLCVAPLKSIQPVPVHFTSWLNTKPKCTCQKPTSDIPYLNFGRPQKYVILSQFIHSQYYGTAASPNPMKQETPDQEEDDKKTRSDMQNMQNTEDASTNMSSASDTQQNTLSDEKPEQHVGVIRGIFKRFKDAYKEYGKALIAVHAVTSCFWFGSFYYAAATGVELVPLLQKIGASEAVIHQIQATGLGSAAVAYLLYKLATPARYTVTIVGTQMTVKRLQRMGYMQPVPKEDSFRELFKEGKTGVKVKYQEKREVLKERAEGLKDEVKEKIKEKTSDITTDLKEKTKDITSDLKEKTKDITSDLKEKMKR